MNLLRPRKVRFVALSPRLSAQPVYFYENKNAGSQKNGVRTEEYQKILLRQGNAYGQSAT